MIRSELVHAIMVDACGVGGALLLAVTAISLEDHFNGVAWQAKCVTQEQIYKPTAECRRVRVR